MYIYTPFSKVRLEKKKASRFYSPRVREGLKFKNNYDLHDVKHKTILYENNKTKKKKHDWITGRPKQWFSFSGTTASYEKQAITFIYIIAKLKMGITQFFYF